MSLYKEVLANNQYRYKASNAGLRICFYETLASTMDEARSMFLSESMASNCKLLISSIGSFDVGKAKLRFAVLSLTQTKGRGTKERTWFSQEGKGLYITFAHDIGSRQRIEAFSSCIGMSIVKAMRRYKVETCLKWPNDVVYKDPTQEVYKKLAGILIERKENMLLVGIGLNLFSQETCFESIGLNDIVSSKVEYLDALETLCYYYLETVKGFFELGFLTCKKEVVESSAVINKIFKVKRDSGYLQAKAVDINLDGSIRFEDCNKNNFDIYNSDYIDYDCLYIKKKP